jgi:flagellin-specific chaperone FliS
VDYWKIFHAAKKNKGNIDKLNKKFGENRPISSSCGIIHEYLGMTLDYTTKGEVKISIYDYINKMLTELPLDI